VGVCLRDGGRGAGGRRGGPGDLERMLASFGGRHAEIGGAEGPWELARFAARTGVAVLVIGDAGRPRRRRPGAGSAARRVLRLAGPIEVWVVPPGTARGGAAPGPGRPRRAGRRAALPPRRRALAWLPALAGTAALVAAVQAIHLAGGPALIVFAATGTAIGALVHALAGPVRRAARFRAEAGQFARLVACAIVEPRLAANGPARSRSGRRPLRIFADELRRSRRPSGAGPGAMPDKAVGRSQDSR
jgi:hypothetical protein